VQVAVGTDTGEIVRYTMSSAALVKSAP